MKKTIVAYCREKGKWVIRMIVGKRLLQKALFQVIKRRRIRLSYIVALVRYYKVQSVCPLLC